VTFVNYWMPSLVALLPIPFVWGPVGGGESAPAAFRGTFSRFGRLYERSRDAARMLAQLDPFVRLTAKRAAVGFATTPDTARRMQALGCRQVRVYSGIGIPRHEIDSRQADIQSPTRFAVISVGGLIHFKGFDLGIRAFAEFHRRSPDSVYWIVGDGRERKRLEQLAETLGVGDRVVFWGALPRDQALAKIREASVLLHPSLHESGACVCLEAMAAARPVICLDHTGPGLHVTAETGIKVPAVQPDQVIRDLSNALSRVADDGDLRARLGLAGQSRIEEHFVWDRKGEFMKRVYSNVIRPAEPQPC
jgi:glycosyltransferase involved in cell wall biosynthesis